MEELLYWGAILGFYLWSAYRSNKKKAERLMPPKTPPKKEVENPQIPNNKKINGFASLTYSPDSKLSSSNSRNIATIQYSSSGAEIRIQFGASF